MLDELTMKALEQGYVWKTHRERDDYCQPTFVCYSNGLRLCYGWQCDDNCGSLTSKSVIGGELKAEDYGEEWALTFQELHTNTEEPPKAFIQAMGQGYIWTKAGKLNLRECETDLHLFFHEQWLEVYVEKNGHSEKLYFHIQSYKRTWWLKNPKEKQNVR